LPSILQKSGSPEKKQRNSILKFFRIRLFNFFSLRKKARYQYEIFSKAEIKFEYEINLSELTHEVETAIVNIIADRLEISREKIKILAMKKGSLLIEIELPSKALDSLIKLYENNDPIIKQIGVSYVCETLIEQYNRLNLRKLLMCIYKKEGLLNLCKENFKEVLLNSPKRFSKRNLVDIIIEYAIQTSKVDLLKEISFKHNPKLYNKYQPYTFEERRPYSRKIEKRSKPSEITIVEYTKSAFWGIGAATLGSLGIILLESTPLRFFSWFLYVPLSNLIGDAILHGSNNKRSRKLGILAVICYLSGFTFAFDIKLIWEGKITNLKEIILLIGFSILLSFLGVIFSIGVDPIRIFNFIFVSTGAYLTYKRVT
jgi:hypothetical protein